MDLLYARIVWICYGKKWNSNSNIIAVYSVFIVQWSLFQCNTSHVFHWTVSSNQILHSCNSSLKKCSDMMFHLRLLHHKNSNCFCLWEAPSDSFLWLLLFILCYKRTKKGVVSNLKKFNFNTGATSASLVHWEKKKATQWNTFSSPLTGHLWS